MTEYKPFYEWIHTQKNIHEYGCEGVPCTCSLMHRKQEEKYVNSIMEHTHEPQPTGGLSDLMIKNRGVTWLEFLKYKMSKK